MRKVVRDATTDVTQLLTLQHSKRKRYIEREGKGVEERERERQSERERETHTHTHREKERGSEWNHRGDATAQALALLAPEPEVIQRSCMKQTVIKID